MLADPPLMMDIAASTSSASSLNSVVMPNGFSSSAISPHSDDASRSAPTSSPNEINSIETPALNDAVASTSANEAPMSEEDSVKKPRKRKIQRSQFCEHVEPEKPECKQRAILGYRLCIRHILNDPEAPYIKCEFIIKSKEEHMNSSYDSDAARSLESPAYGVEGAIRQIVGSSSTIHQHITAPSTIAAHLTASDERKTYYSYPYREDGLQNPVYRAPMKGQNDVHLIRANGMFTDSHGHQVVVHRFVEPSETAVVGSAGPPPQAPHVVHVQPPPVVQKPRAPFLPRRPPLDFFRCKVPAITYDSRILRVGEKVNLIDQLRADYLNPKKDEKEIRHREVRLSHKCRNLRIDGSFRQIPSVDAMCSLMESEDFDNADLFPSGFEPSDSEEDSSDLDDLSLNCFPRIPYFLSSQKNRRLELYLIKKRIKQTSDRLQKNARIAMHVINAARSYPDAVGAALRVRHMNKRRLNAVDSTGSIQRCFYAEGQDSRKRCQNIAVPRSSMCVYHIGYSIDQRAFSFCTAPCCGRSVLKLNMLVFGTLCEQHYVEKMHERPHENGHNVPPSVSNAPSLQIPSSYLNHTTYTDMPPPKIPTTHNDCFAPPTSSVHHSLDGLPSAKNRRCSDSEGDVSADFLNSISMDDFNVTDVVDGDVSLSSVANALCHEEFNDIFPMPIAEEIDDTTASGIQQNLAVDNDGILFEEGDGLLNLQGVYHNNGNGFCGPAMDEDPSHSWADVSEFLRSEGYCGSPSPHGHRC